MERPMSGPGDDAMGCAPKTAHTWRLGDDSWREETVPACSASDDRAVLSRIKDIATPDVCIWLINADKARECPECRRELSTAARIPDLWWTGYCRNSNGHFGYEEVVDDKGDVAEVVTWTRFLVKVLQQEDQDDYHWLKFNVLIHWDASTRRTNILLFDLPLTLREPVLASLQRSVLLDVDSSSSSSSSRAADPFWPYPALVEHLVARQDEAVWALRTLVRRIEKTREMSADTSPRVFTRMHDLARHAVHISETLDVGVDSLAALVDRHGAFAARADDGGGGAVHHRLLAFQNLLQSLRRRSGSNHDRLQNEIQLAFNLVSWRDAAISRDIAAATQADSAAMKTIATLTTAFLPATFVAAIFSTSFFSLDDAGRWVMSPMFWVYWAFAIPISLATTGWWIYWHRGKPAPPVIEGDKSAGL